MFATWLIRGCTNKLLTKLNISMVFETKYGIKSYNQLLDYSTHKTLNQTTISYKDLYLGIDALKDQYSLLGVNIAYSPHYYLIEAFENNYDIKRTDYVIRTMKGTLDGRNGIFIRNRYLNVMKRKFLSMKNKVLNEDYEPVTVALVDSKYYIIDGKHRAAMCAFFKKRIICNVISSDALLDSFNLWLFRKMEGKKHYQKHQNMYNKLTER